MRAESEQISAEEIIASLDRLSLNDLEQVFDRVLAAQAERRAPHLPSDESALLERINEGLPEALRARLLLLRSKREDGSIEQHEYNELTELTDRAEELHADRMAALVALAKLRGAPLPAIMDQLGIRFPHPVEMIFTEDDLPEQHPVQAIFTEDDLPEQWKHFTPIDADYYKK